MYTLGVFLLHDYKYFQLRFLERDLHPLLASLGRNLPSLMRKYVHSVRNQKKYRERELEREGEIQRKLEKDGNRKLERGREIEGEWE